MGDLPGKLAAKTKAGGSHFRPATNRCFGRRSMKGRIHFNGWEVAGIKFEPVRLWQIMGIKNSAPVIKAPRARANTYFLLVEQIQMESKKYPVLCLGKDVSFERRDCAKNLTAQIS